MTIDWRSSRLGCGATIRIRNIMEYSTKVANIAGFCNAQPAAFTVSDFLAPRCARPDRADTGAAPRSNRDRSQSRIVCGTSPASERFSNCHCAATDAGALITPHQRLHEVPCDQGKKAGIARRAPASRHADRLVRMSSHSMSIAET
jgi:hypothetical protein